MEELKQQKLEILTKCLGEYELLKDPQVRFFCPFCLHHKKKLEINLETTQFHCWVCNEGGAAKTLVRLYGSKELLNDWYERIEGKKLVGDYDLKEMLSLKKEVESIAKSVSLPLEARPLLNNIPSLTAKHAIKFLSERRVSYSSIRMYDMHYCEDGIYRDRIIIPSYDDEGKVNFFIGRAIFDNSDKYMNSEVNKNDIIFNELFITWERPVILTEGFFDALAVKHNAIPLLGSNLSESSLLFKKLMHYKPQIILFFDNDQAGHDATKKIAKLLYDWNSDIWHVPWGNSHYKDPGEMPQKEISLILKNIKRVTAGELMRKMLE